MCHTVKMLIPHRHTVTGETRRGGVGGGEMRGKRSIALSVLSEHFFPINLNLL